jgi:hypothetical protein
MNDDHPPRSRPSTRLDDSAMTTRDLDRALDRCRAVRADRLETGAGAAAPRGEAACHG